MAIVMKTHIFVAAMASILCSSPALAWGSDESNCVTGPMVIGNDYADHINALSTRLVACINYLQGQIQQSEIDTLTKINQLQANDEQVFNIISAQRAEIASLRDRIKALEARSTSP